MIEPIYTNDNVTLYCGDCLQIMPQLNVKFDACITDLPYGTIKDYTSWDTILPMDKVWDNMNNLIKDNGAILLFGQQPFSSMIRLSNLKMFRYDWIWHKSIGGNFLCASKQPHKHHQIISVFYRKQPTYNPQMKDLDFIRTNNTKAKNYGLKTEIGVKKVFKSIKPMIKEYRGRYPESVIYFGNGNNNRLHFCQKPTDLLSYLIKTYTNQGDILLDCTAGSGSLGQACMLTNRRCILIEKDSRYCDIIINRLNTFDPNSIKRKKIKTIKVNQQQMEFEF